MTSSEAPQELCSVGQTLTRISTLLCAEEGSALLLLFFFITIFLCTMPCIQYCFGSTLHWQRRRTDRRPPPDSSEWQRLNKGSEKNYPEMGFLPWNDHGTVQNTVNVNIFASSSSSFELCRVRASSARGLFFVDAVVVVDNIIFQIISAGLMNWFQFPSSSPNTPTQWWCVLYQLIFHLLNVPSSVLTFIGRLILPAEDTEAEQWPCQKEQRL